MKDTSKWGRDHWSLLAFIETQVVDGKSKLDLKRMRVNEGKRSFSNGNNISWENLYATTLKDNSIPDINHDDIDILEELIECGFVINTFTDLNPVVKMTELGWNVCAELRKHKGNGGRFNNFVYIK